MSMINVDLLSIIRSLYEEETEDYKPFNRTACIRHQCRKTTVSRCHRCLINPGVKKLTTFKSRLVLLHSDVSK